MAEHTSKERPEEISGRAGDSPGRDRRSRHRVDDDQKSGQGSLSALSKLKMIERKKAAMRPASDHDHED